MFVDEAHLAAMEGHLPCLKYLVGEGRNTIHILGARNNNGETPRLLAQQFYKTKVVDYITNLEWERDHPEEAQSKRSFNCLCCVTVDTLMIDVDSG